MTVNETIDRYKLKLQEAERSIEQAERAICNLRGARELSEDRRALATALDRISETLHGLYRLYDNGNIKSDAAEQSETTNQKTFTVSMAVDGRIDVTVEACDAQDAFEKAKDAFMEADLSKMETVDGRPVNAYDNDTHTLTDYE